MELNPIFRKKEMKERTKGAVIKRGATEVVAAYPLEDAIIANPQGKEPTFSIITLK